MKPLSIVVVVSVRFYSSLTLERLMIMWYGVSWIKSWLKRFCVQMEVLDRELD